MSLHIARWRWTIATVWLAALPACATLNPPPSTMPTVGSDDAVVAAPGCLPGTERIGYDTAGFVLAGAFLGALVAGKHLSSRGNHDIEIGMLLGLAVGTWLNAHRHCPDTGNALVP